MRIHQLAIRVTLILLLSPMAAHADGLFTPFLGRAEGQPTFGFAVGGMGREVIGLELDLAFTPDFFEPDGTIADSNLITIMGNMIVGAPIGPVRPYGSGGVGLIRRRLSGLTDLIAFDLNDLGVNVGGGVMGFFNDRVGLRGDLRYFRSLQKGKQGLLDFELGTFDFWRGSVGVVLRF